MTDLSALLQRFAARYRAALLAKAVLLAGLSLGSIGVLAWRLHIAQVAPSWSIGVPAGLALLTVAGFAWWLRRSWLSPRVAAAHLDQTLDLEQRLMTAAAFADSPTPPPLYPLLLEDTQRHVTEGRIRLPRPVDRTTGALAVLLLALLLWPVRGHSPLQFASLPAPSQAGPKPPTPPPPTPAEPPPPQPQDQPRSSGGSQSPQSSSGGQQPQSSGSGDQRKDQQRSQGSGSSQQPSGPGRTGAPSPQSSGQNRSQQSAGQQGTGSSSSNQQNAQGRQGRGEQGAGQSERAGAQPASAGQQSASSGSSKGAGQSQGGQQQGASQRATAQGTHGQGGGAPAGNQEALKADIQGLLKELSGELKQLQAELESNAKGQPNPQAGTGSDPELYESAQALDPAEGAALPIQLQTDAAEIQTKRRGGGVGERSDEVARAGPQTQAEAAELSDQPLEETAQDRQRVPPEYRTVFTKLSTRPEEPREATR